MTIYQKYLAIGHRHLPYFHPLSLDKFEEAIEKINLKPHQVAVDFGGGKGEFIIKLIEKFGVKGIVVEVPGSSAAEVRSRAKGRISLKKIEVSLSATQGFLAESEAKDFDLVACINSVAMGTNFRKILTLLEKTTKPGGLIFIGQPYWKNDPSKEFLKNLKSAMGQVKSDFATLEQFFLEAERNRLVPLWSTLASQDEIDRYEWSINFEIENHVRSNRNEKDNKAILDFSRASRKFFLRSRRDCWGFGLHILRKE